MNRDLRWLVVGLVCTVHISCSTSVSELNSGTLITEPEKSIDSNDDHDLNPPIVELLSCPGGYTLVPKNDDLGTEQFCIAIYEMRNVSSTAKSVPTGLPWLNVSRDSALAACQAEGVGYDLISNAQWQAAARNVARVAANWSQGSVGYGYLNIGNADVGGYQPCASTAEYVDTSCSAMSATGNFIRKRTHVLSTGAVLWDMGGNNYEIVKTLSTAGQYSGGGCANALGSTNPANDQLGSPMKAFGLGIMFGPSLDTSVSLCAGLGSLVREYSNNVSSHRAVVRGGASFDPSGIFAADIGWVNASMTDSSYSFRCIYK